MMALLGLARLPEGTVEMRGEVTVIPGLTALPTPGHTPGHYAFLWHDAALIGDAALTAPDGELCPFTPQQLMKDAVQADATFQMLCTLQVRIFCPGTAQPESAATTDSAPGPELNAAAQPTHSFSRR